MSDATTQSNVDPESKPAELRVPREPDMLIYSFAQVPFNWARNAQQMFYPYFMTNILMMNPALMGTISLISRFIGMFMNIIAGGMMDKVHIKKHKYAFWINFSTPLSMLAYILLFINYHAMGINTATMSLLAIVLSTMGAFFGAFAASAHTGLYAVMGVNKATSTKMTTRRALGQSFGMITTSLIAMPLVRALGGGNEGKGYLLTMTLFCISAVICYYWITVVTRPWDPLGTDLATKKGPAAPSVKELFAAIFANPPLLIFVLSNCFRWSSRMMLTGFAIYNFRYVFGSTMLMAGFMTAMNLVSFASTIVGEPVEKKIGKDAVFLWGNVLLMLSFLGAMFFGRNNSMIYIVFICIGHIGYGPTGAQVMAFNSECADYMKKKSGKDSRTTVMATTYFCSVFGAMVAGSLTGYCLAAVGFTPQNVTPEVVNGIFRISALVPSLLLILCIVTFLFYMGGRKRWFGSEK